MAFKGARSDPVQGVKGAKPRLRLPKLPRRPETETTVQLNEEYLRKRNMILDLKYKREAMELAVARGQLIEKALVEHQLAYLLIPMRQALLALPGKLRRKLGERFDHEMVSAAKELIHETLTNISNLPLASEPDWLERLEEKEG
jgi:hypothetical protein